jgi:hypothetical protein
VVDDEVVATDGSQALWLAPFELDPHFKRPSEQLDKLLARPAT